MPAHTIEKSTFAFLKQLEKNNNRDWFLEHKADYTKAHENMIAFAEKLLELMNTHDKIETASGKKSLHRIYRDIRFSKNKTPYKNNLSGGFRRATPLLRGGYYYHMEPGNVMLAGGFWGPSSEDLLRIRKGIQADQAGLEKILNSKSFKDNFGQLYGEGVKTAPKGFDKEDPAIEYLRKKQFIVKKHFTDKEALSADFAEQASNTFKAMKPLFGYFSDILTTDANGVLIV